MSRTVSPDCVTTDHDVGDRFATGSRTSFIVSSAAWCSIVASVSLLASTLRSDR
jgi:hypothetical protein